MGTFILIVLVGTLMMMIGLRRGERRARAGVVREQEAAALNRPKEPICGCTHSLAFHDEHGCHQQVLLATFAANGQAVFAQEVTPCRCVKYVGPEPITEYLP